MAALSSEEMAAAHKGGIPLLCGSPRTDLELVGKSTGGPGHRQQLSWKVVSPLKDFPSGIKVTHHSSPMSLKCHFMSEGVHNYLI